MLLSHPNIAQIEIVARALGELCDEVTFVGGATVPLYIEDEAAWFPPPSNDIDCVVEMATRHSYSKFEGVLRKRGFRDPSSEETEDGAPICRKYLRDLAIDIMPSDPKVLGFSNKWFPGGIDHRVSVRLASGVNIHYFPAMYFIAAKIEAYKGRGRQDDPRVSRDLEDFINIMDGMTEASLGEAIAGSEKKLLRAVSDDCRKLLRDRLLLKEAVVGFIRDEARAERIMKRIEDHLVGQRPSGSGV